MLRQKCFYRKDIETHKSPTCKKKKKKIELKFEIQKKQVKAKFLTEMLVHDDISKNVTSYSKSFFAF